ncbi:MAG: chromate transporter [Thermotogaceae bacterium]|nr:chromate transporter [Thermotogaceae bacterium]
MKAIDLFFCFMKIGFLAFGGGYGALSMIQNEVVRVHEWMTNPEFLDLLSISQMTPGPIAINSATYIGYRIAGLSGAVLSTIGVILPSFMWMYFISFIIERILRNPRKLLRTFRTSIIAPILAAGINLTLSTVNDLISFILALLLFMLLRSKKLSLIQFILVAGGLGIVVKAF